MFNYDWPRFVAIMALLAQNFRDEVFHSRLKTDLTYRFNLLSDFPIIEIERAANKIVAKRKFMKMPTVGEIITTIEEDDDVSAISDDSFSMAIAVFERQLLENAENDRDEED